MANLAPPSSQKTADRPIGFLLDDRAFGFSKSIDLSIRPEDLARTDTSRVSVQQTLGSSVWADSFGPGLPTITISGHTGWRRQESGSGADGVERFMEFKAGIYDDWHERRRVAANLGLDPDQVKLIFSDVLDGFACVVVPTSFVLRRSKSRPLLAQYQLSLTVTNQEIDAPYDLLGAAGASLGYLLRGAGPGGAAVTEVLGLESMTASVGKITGALTAIKSAIDASILSPVRVFMNQTARLYGAVRGAISAATSIAGSLISVAQMTAAAGVNLFRTLAAIASIPQQAKALLMSVAGAYSNILCVLKNALRQKTYYQDYGSLYGSSNCSSTSGGRPISSLAGQNPFYLAVPTSSAFPVKATPAAQSSLATLAASDPVLAPMSATNIAASVRNVADGLVVA